MAKGGTGLATLTAHALMLGNGVSAVNFLSPGTARNVAVSDGTDWTSRALAFADLPAINQQMVISINGVLSTGLYPLRFPNELGGSRTISKVYCSVNTPSTGASIIIDILNNGTTIFTGGTNRPVIAAAANTGSTTTIDVPTWAANDYLQLTIAQVGSTFAGSDLTVVIVYAQ